MNSDIRVAVSFRGHRKRKKLEKKIGPAGTCALINLWIGAALSSSDGVLRGWDEEDIELEAEWQGDPGKFFEAIKDEWIEWDDELSCWRLHDWMDHQGWCYGAKERSERARRAAIVKHHGKDGLKRYLAKKGESDE